MKKLLTGLSLVLIFGYTFFFTSWTASYLAYEDDWKSKLTFTPTTVTDPQKIYVIDQFLYAFKIQPIISLIFLFTTLCLVSLLGIYLYKYVIIKFFKVSKLT
ncbi:hypothetical protein JOC75_002902 [Metabacillus crassostreae]|uniref:DUF4306 domain-containing protein n=1 Tax=Metabacillus crassostreae TaxID=929098 RepID=UPI00195BF1E2|nr:DUF4306 domain-containing protein [Metabacillus crassostreae]MBM7604898.1 hypothetical protein [Metabacillus crassostreae]